MQNKTVNHWGKFVSSDSPVTGVMTVHSLNWECLDETCVTCESIYNQIQMDESLSEEEKESELESVECDSSHTKIFGNWKKDDNGQYIPDESGDFSAILNESTVQIVWSKNTQNAALCSPCFPGQVDLDTLGEFLGYCLPEYMIYKG